MSRIVLMSVKPRYAHALLGGSKTAEIRRRFPHLPEGTVVVVYASSPERKVIGTFTIGNISRLPADRLWAVYGRKLSLTRQELRDYLRGVRLGIAIEPSAYEKWHTPVALADLRQRAGMDAPQSWRYMTAEQVQSISPCTETVEMETRLASIAP